MKEKVQVCFHYYAELTTAIEEQEYSMVQKKNGNFSNSPTARRSFKDGISCNIVYRVSPRLANMMHIAPDEIGAIFLRLGIQLSTRRMGKRLIMYNRRFSNGEIGLHIYQR